MIYDRRSTPHITLNNEDLECQSHGSLSMNQYICDKIEPFQHQNNQISDKDFFADFSQDMLLKIDDADCNNIHKPNLIFNYNHKLQPTSASFLDTSQKDLELSKKARMSMT